MFLVLFSLLVKLLAFSSHWNHESSDLASFQNQVQTISVSSPQGSSAKHGCVGGRTNWLQKLIHLSLGLRICIAVILFAHIVSCTHKFILYARKGFSHITATIEKKLPWPHQPLRFLIREVGDTVIQTAAIGFEKRVQLLEKECIDHEVLLMDKILQQFGYGSSWPSKLPPSKLHRPETKI